MHSHSAEPSHVRDGDAYESDDGESTDEESYVKVPKPCTDIKAALASALKTRSSRTEFRGTFAFTHTYNTTPHPGLNIAGFGQMPVPLTQSSAQSLIACCGPASLKRVKMMKAEKTWEILADKITFENPHWNKWIESSVIPQVRQHFDLDFVPKWSFTKLVLGGEGSCTMFDSSVPSSKSVFATLKIILPSLFDGGQLYMYHEGLEKSFDVAKESAFCTSIMASFWGTSLVSHPVKRGYRLALIFDMSAPSHIPTPNLSKFSNTVGVLRHVLLSWRQDKSPGVPSKLAYILDRYPDQGMTGSNVNKLEVLRSLAKECNFRVYLATALLHIEESTDLYGSGYDEDDHSNLDEVYGSGLTLTGAKDSEGHVDHLPADLQFEDPEDFIPCSMQDDGPVKQHFSKQTGEFEKVYKTNVILLWPRNRDESVLAREWLASASKRLSRPTSGVPSAKLRRLAERMKSCLMETMDRTGYRELCLAALRWNDADLFLRTSQNHGFPSLVSEFLTNQELVDITLAFGFEKMKDLLTQILADSCSNSGRFEFLTMLSKELSQDQAVARWCEKQRDIAIRTLNYPYQEDIGHFMHFSRANGVEFVQSTLIPQLVSLKCRQEFWTAFLEALQAERDQLASSTDAVDKMIKATLMSFLKTTELRLAIYRYTDGVQTTEYDPQPTLELIQLCANLNAMDACAAIFKKVEEFNKERGHASRKNLVTHVYRPILDAIPKLANLRQPINLHNPPFLLFLEMLAGEIMELNLRGTNPDGKAAAQAVKLCKSNGIKILASRVMTILKEPESTPTRTLTLVRLLKATWQLDSATDENQKLEKLIEKMIIFSISKGHVIYDESAYRYSYRKPKHVQNAKDVLLLCLDADHAALSSHLFARLLKSEKDAKPHFIEVVLPFIIELQTELKSRNIPLPAEPFGTFYRNAIVKFATEIMGPRPAGYEPSMSQELAVFNCNCALCEGMKTKLASTKNPIKYEGNTSNSQHIEDQFGSQLGLTVCNTRLYKGRHSVNITKPVTFVAFSEWCSLSQAALDVIKALGDPVAQRSILGDDYSRVSDLLGLVTVSQNTYASSARSSGKTKSSSVRSKRSASDLSLIQ
ncbi:hypothetical protein SISNIDRAFT_430651, partial [Sistotremastrum niveocremeum HHB9708]